MSITDKINSDVIAAMKEKKSSRVEALRMLKSALLELAKSGAEVSEEMEKKVLQKQAKMRRESIQQFRDAGRDELAEREEAELSVIEEYLPAMMSDEEISVLVENVIAETGASSMSDFKVVMPKTMGAVSGRADGASVQKIVREALTRLQEGG